MGQAMFYHLTRNPMEVALADLLERALSRGMRVAVRGVDHKRLEALDETLWLGAEDRFLPHGLAGGPHDAMQPILLTTSAQVPNEATCVMAVDGAEVTPEDVDTYDRVCVLFDGMDEAMLQGVRAQWKTLKDAGSKAQYWSEESGRWEMKVET